MYLCIPTPSMCMCYIPSIWVNPENPVKLPMRALIFLYSPPNFNIILLHSNKGRALAKKIIHNNGHQQSVFNFYWQTILRSKPWHCCRLVLAAGVVKLNEINSSWRLYTAHAQFFSIWFQIIFLCFLIWNSFIYLFPAFWEIS